MALISCPECGKDISDKVKACPHCGYPLDNDTRPENSAPTPQPVEVVSVKVNPQKPKKLIMGVIIAVALIAVCALVVTVVDRQNKAAARTEYIENLTLARSTMLTGGAQAESLCNLTKAVWYNTINEEYSYETDPFTKKDGKFNEDFNDSLEALYADSGTKKTVTEIKENQKEVAEIMRSLQNPPDDLAACFSTIEAMYDVYSDFTNLAMSPSGSLRSYSENFRDYDNDFMRLYDKLDTQIPDE